MQSSSPRHAHPAPLRPARPPTSVPLPRPEVRSVRRASPPPLSPCACAGIGSQWFSFRQNSQLDASDLYVPHPWKRAWAGIGCGVVFTPPLVDALIKRRHGRAAACALAMAVPWLMAKLDPELRSKCARGGGEARLAFRSLDGVTPPCHSGT